jgi:hypothetical protein
MRKTGLLFHIKIIFISNYKPTYLSSANPKVYNRIGHLSSIRAIFRDIRSEKIGLVVGVSGMLLFLLKTPRVGLEPTT